MRRRFGTGLVVAVLFTLINFLGAGYALFERDFVHLLTHVLFLGIGAYWMMRLVARARPAPVPEPVADDRLRQIEQSLDSIALGVERLGEAQRFTAKLAAKKLGLNQESRSSAEGDP